MTYPALPADDLPLPHPVQEDEILRRKLEKAAARYFYEACDGVTQSVLSSCEWFITIQANALILAITCANAAMNLRVLNNLVPLGAALEEFSPSARIRIYSPEKQGSPFEICVDEISLYRDLL